MEILRRRAGAASSRARWGGGHSGCLLTDGGPMMRESKNGENSTPFVQWIPREVQPSNTATLGHTITWPTRPRPRKSTLTVPTQSRGRDPRERKSRSNKQGFLLILHKRKPGEHTNNEDHKRQGNIHKIYKITKSQN